MIRGLLTEELVHQAEERAQALEASQGQSGANGDGGWSAMLAAVAERCDGLKETLTEEAAARGVSILLPDPLEGFGPQRTYIGRASAINGIGDYCSVLTVLAAAADDFWAACIALGMPADKLPSRHRATWVETWQALTANAPRLQMFISLFARGLLDLGGVIVSWRAVPVEAPAKQRKRA
jgi:hypothetical protein